MGRKRKLKRKKKRRWFSLLVIICFTWVLGNIFIYNASELSSLWKNIIQGEDFRNISQSSEWNLIVVNHWNEIPDNYSVALTELSNGQKVDSRIYPDLQEMFSDARTEGIYPIVRRLEN